VRCIPAIKESDMMGAGSSLNSRLVEILEEKHREVDALKRDAFKQKGRLKGLEEGIPPIRNFKGAISREDRVGLIAEIKFASPSAGPIRDKTDPVDIGKVYEEAGASAISFLTDKKFFAGDIRGLLPLKKAISLPILRKDFIIDVCQIEESRVFGADAVLLIAGLLSLETLKTLLAVCRDAGMAALTEVHNREDLEKAIESRAEIIGINNRDLNTFEVRLGTTFELAPLIPKDRVIVSESGIHDGKDIRMLRGLGIRAVLVGSALMASDALEEKTKELVTAGILGLE
jgi:indole-3-glycerol phosphate synthase